MSSNYIIFLIVLFSLGCSKPQSTIKLDQKVYILPEGEATQVFQFIANQIADIKHEQALKDAPNNAGYAPFAYFNRSFHPDLNDEEWVNYCSSSIFSYLDHPIESNGVQIGNKSNVFTISHSKEAIHKFDQLLIRWTVDNPDKFLEYLEFSRALMPSKKSANKSQ